MRRNVRAAACLAAILALLLTACGGGDSALQDAAAASEGSAASGGSEADDGGVSGTVEVDGSSTVGPLTDAIAEEYDQVQPGVNVNVGVSGTGGGFERFCAGETDISNASRPIEDEEAQLCADNGVEYTEIRVGTDALTMVTSPDTEGIACLTTEHVARIFGPDSVRNWREVDPSFPDEEIQVFAPDTDSGTYDFMVEDVLGLEESTQDYNASADDNVILQGVMGTPYAWGFFGYAYYQSSADSLKAFEYDAGDGCVAPSEEAARNGSYQLTRPLFIYVKNSALQDEPQVAEFATFYLDTVDDVIEDVGYIPADQAVIDESKTQLRAAIAGEPSGGASQAATEAASAAAESAS